MKKAGAIALMPLLMLILLASHGLVYAQTPSGEEDPVQEPASVNGDETYDNSTADIIIIFDDFTIEDMSAVNQQIEHIFASVELLDLKTNNWHLRLAMDL